MKEKRSFARSCWAFVTQDHIDAYHALLDAYGGNPPTVRDTLQMNLSEATARLEDVNPEGAKLGDFWLRVSSLTAYKSIWLPLVGNPYVSDAKQVSKGISAVSVQCPPHGSDRTEPCWSRAGGCASGFLRASSA